VRQFKNQTTDEQRQYLISGVTSWRLLVTILFCAVSAPVLWSLRIPNSWMLAILSAYPLLIFGATQSSWLLMAEENMPANSRALAVQSVLAGLCYLIIFRPGQRLGSDVMVMAAATGAGWLYGWHVALGTKWRIRFGSDYFRIFGHWLSKALANFYWSDHLPVHKLECLACIPSAVIRAGEVPNGVFSFGVIGSFWRLCCAAVSAIYRMEKARSEAPLSRQLRLALVALIAVIIASAFCFAFARPIITSYTETNLWKLPIRSRFLLPPNL